MKKIKLALCGLTFMAFVIANAQDQTTTATPPMKKAMKAKAMPASTAMPAKGTHMTKAGKPDMRYKENKANGGKPAMTPAKPMSKGKMPAKGGAKMGGTKKAMSTTTPPQNKQQ
jgi:hypothetical protein